MMQRTPSRQVTLSMYNKPQTLGQHQGLLVTRGRAAEHHNASSGILAGAPSRRRARSRRREHPEG
eukprot:5420489-Pyramimonas_sp.AAC.1